MIHDIESIPYNIVEERARYRESIYRERAVASERVRLAMGLSLRPENRSVHLTDGVKASNIDEKYYEPPLMQVIPSACSACESNKYEVSNMCRGCVAHPCMLTCPKGAISMVNGRSFIDQEKCIHFAEHFLRQKMSVTDSAQFHCYSLTISGQPHPYCFHR